MKYRVIRDCIFQHRLWLEGEIADFPAGVKVPEHFQTPPTELAMEPLPENLPEEILQEETPREVKQLEEMTIAELKDLAQATGIDIPTNTKKAEIIAMLREE